MNLGPAPQGVETRFSGRVSALAFGQDKFGQTALFVGAASGGVWRTTDVLSNSPTWINTTAQIGLGNVDFDTGLGAGLLNVGAIAVDPNNQKILYCGTGEANLCRRRGLGIWHSQDHKRWQQLDLGFQRPYRPHFP